MYCNNYLSNKNTVTVNVVFLHISVICDISNELITFILLLASAEGCPYTKENLSYGEYQLSIDMPANSSPPYDVVLTFDANTTIVSCEAFYMINYTGILPREAATATATTQF